MPVRRLRAVCSAAALAFVLVPGIRAATKGWLEASRGQALFPLPEGARNLGVYGERVFVELGPDARAAIAERGLDFEEIADADWLAVGPERFDVRRGEPPIAAEWRARGAEGAPRRPYLIKFEAPLRPEWMEALTARGAEIVQYQPHFGLLLLASPRALAALGEVEHVAFRGEYHGAYKASATLRARAAREETITLRVVSFDVEGWQDAVERALVGASVVHRSAGEATSQWSVLHHTILEGVSTRQLSALLREPSVYWSEEWLPPQPEDERSSQIVAGNYSGSAPVPGYGAWLATLGADGSGVTVAVADTGLDTGLAATMHDDLAGRVSFATALCGQNRDRDGHGTNVTAIAAGDPRPPTGTGIVDGNGFYWGSGVAPGASVYFQKALDGGDCGASYNANANTLAQDAVRNGGASVGNHSFTDGLGGGAGYNSQCQAWDARVRDADPGTAGLQPYSVVFSAGNSGPSAGSLSSPHAAKNMITVGATENFLPGQCPGISGCGGSADDIDLVVPFSSRGPTADGRIKPDVVAPGHVVAGARATNGFFGCFCDGQMSNGCCASTGVGSNLYSIYSGTSQASPGVAGASALTYDWFAGRFGSFPSPAMNKAILVDGAVDLQAADAPNSIEGWGRVHLTNSLLGPPGVYTDQTFVVGAVGDAGSFTASYFAQDPTRPLKATLVWTDPPGAVGCNPCLVNNLDLLVTQGATTWRGNNFTGGLSNTSPTSDSLNNVEGVRLPGVSLGCSPFGVRVRAAALNGDGVPGNADTTDQDFALVVSNAATTAAPPRIDVASSSISGGCDADGSIDRQETATLALGVANIGCTAATGVTATVSVESQPPGASLTVSPSGPVVVGSIASGATAPAQWLVSLAGAPSTFCGRATLRADFTDAAARSWSETFEVKLDTDGSSTVTDTDTVDQDHSLSADADWSRQSCRTTSPSLAWHMGQADCTGIPRDAAIHDLVFSYPLGAGDLLTELSFRHAFGAYSNASLTDTIQIDVDPENDGTFVTLQTWRAVDGAIGTMTLAGPYDLTPFRGTQGEELVVRFRFTGGAQWVGGPNNATGWDVDDITLRVESPVCDAEPCSACSGAPPALADVPGGTGPLAVSRSGGNLTLSWPAQACAVRYNVYAGTIGTYWNHAIFSASGLDGANSCHEPTNVVTFADPGGDLYFLVSADNGVLEGSLGPATFVDPRPYASPSCSAHE